MISMQTFLISLFLIGRLGSAETNQLKSISIENKPDCLLILEEYQGRLDKSGSTSASPSEISEPTVKLIFDDSNQHPEQLHIQKLPKKTWGSVYRTMKLDPQGNPKWVVMVLGPIFGKVMGFEEIDENNLLTPLPSRIAKGLATLNQNLENLGFEKVAVGFYDQPQSKSPLLNYLFQWIKFRQLPIADFTKNLNHYLHDISFHLSSALFIPPAWYSRYTEIAQKVLEYDNSLLEKYKGTQYEVWSKMASDQIRLSLSRRLDSLSGSIILAVMATTQNSIFPFDNIPHDELVRRHLERLFNYANSTTYNEADLIANVSLAVNRSLGPNIENLPDSDPMSWYGARSFFKSLREDLNRIYRELQSTKLVFNFDETCNYIAQRKKQLIKAATRARELTELESRSAIPIPVALTNLQ